METGLQFGGINFSFQFDRILMIDEELRPFEKTGLSESEVDVTAEISWDWEGVCLPDSDRLSGRDLLQDYYLKEEPHLCITRGGPKGAVACTRYTDEFRHMKCIINERPFLKTPGNLGSILRFFPMRSLFQHFGVLFFHGAQVTKKGKGILFTGPSGAGKTTQAELWERYEGAEKICNDRTLVRREGGLGGWKTYGYPIDGSAPVGSNKIHGLGCIVLLGKKKENGIERLNAGQMVAGLMPQMVIDGWNEKARVRAMELLLELFSEIPVYRLFCTPDKRAVECLKEQLGKDGIIE